MTDKLLDTLSVTAQIETELPKTHQLKVAVPFITTAGVGLLAEQMENHPRRGFHVELLTRFDTESILAGVCELEALRTLLNLQTSTVTIQIRRTNNLHAKFFIFDERAIIIGSSNMTLAAQSTNIEMGFFTTSRSAIQKANAKFTSCWQDSILVDDDWIKLQQQLLKPFIERYKQMKSELSGMMVLHSIRMPGTETKFLASLRQILKKAGTKTGVSKKWIEEEMKEAAKKVAKSGIVDDGPNINVCKRIFLLKVLDLVDVQADNMVLTATGIKCKTDDKLLLTKMVESFPILRKSYNAVPLTGFCTFKEIAHIDPDPTNITNPSQALRDAIHWLSAFGLIYEERDGNAYKFKRKKSVLASLLS